MRCRARTWCCGAWRGTVALACSVGRQLEERARDWQPWRSYAVMHLWARRRGRAAYEERAPAVRVRRVAHASNTNRAGSPTGTRWTAPSGRCCSPGTVTRSRGCTFRRGRGRCDRRRPGGSRMRRPFERAIRQLGEYFAGTRRMFRPAAGAIGHTVPDERVARPARIPYGQTTFLRGNSRAAWVTPTAPARSGWRTARIPLPVIVPCHRVIGADGSLTGFGGGL